MPTDHCPVCDKPLAERYARPYRWHPHCRGGMTMTKRGQWVSHSAYIALYAEAISLERQVATLRRQIGHTATRGLHHV